LTVTSPLSLHVPDEPTVRAEAWLAAVLDGDDLRAVLGADDGLTAWLWSRWSSLAAAGVSEEAFAGIVVDYRRELWLWLAGERTWAHACSGLAGRVGRRIVPAAATGV
jgi:hypothetical protein